MRYVARTGLVLTLMVVIGLAVVQSRKIYLKHQQTIQRQAVRQSIDAKLAAESHAKGAFGKMALTFEPNAGQTDARVKYLSRRGGYVLFLTSNEAVFKLPIPPVL